MPFSRVASYMPPNTAFAVSGEEWEPILSPKISLVEQPTTKSCPRCSFAFSMISSAAALAWR